MIKIVDGHSEDPLRLLSMRSVHRDQSTTQVVAKIIEDVRERGDSALLENARQFDSPDLQKLEVTEAEMVAADSMLSAAEKLAIFTSKNRILNFHTSQLARLTASDEPGDGGGWEWALRAKAWQRTMPLASAGAYVPGGNACYPSSVLMNVVPAVVAGVKRIVVTTPARRDGTLHPAVLHALRSCGVSHAFKVGGAAAIAALAYGTESVPRVDKIVGPGNRYVNEAKRQVWGAVGLDGYAGPSEVCVLADDTTIAAFAAADLLTQIEHAPDNAGFLVVTSRSKLDEILVEVETQLVGAERETTMRSALAKESIAFVAKDLVQACEIVDAIAPEHLSIAAKEPELAMSMVHNAGCILLGEWSPESAGDFAAGPSHTLPTSGAARYGSPVNVLDFLKVQSVIQLSRENLSELLPTIEAFGQMEGFPTHARGASIRFDQGD